MADYSDLNVIMETSPLHTLATQCQIWESENISVITLMDRLQSLQNRLTHDQDLARINSPHEMQMLTYCSNLLSIQSSNALDAELKINLLLNHMMSQSSWVRCVTCSLLKNLWLKLDSTGKHFVVQSK